MRIADIQDDDTRMRALFIDGAIRFRDGLEFTYKDKFRTVLPFMLGMTRDEKLVLQAYQLGDGGGWRFFYLNEIPVGGMSHTNGPRPDSEWIAAMGGMKKSENASYKLPAFVTSVLAAVEIP